MLKTRPLGSTCLDVDDITILNNILLTLGHDLTLGLDLGFFTKFLECVVVENESLDEGLLEIVVNDTSGLRSLGASTDGPLSNLISSDSEEAAKLQGLAHLKNDLGQNRVDTNVLHLFLGLGLSLELSKTRLVGDRDRDKRITLGVLVDPLNDLGKMLVLLADEVLLGQVDKVDDGLGSEEEKRVDDLNLYERVSKVSLKSFSNMNECEGEAFDELGLYQALRPFVIRKAGTPGALADILAVVEPGQDLLKGVLVLHGLLLLKTLAAHAGLLLLVLDSLFSELNILESQLLADDVEITGGVHVTLNVDNLGVIEATDNLEDGIDSTNVGQESVSKTSTVGGDNGFGLVLLDQPVESIIRNDDTGFLRVDGSIREVLDAVSTPILKTMDGEGASYSWVTEIGLGNGLEEGRFADVCQTDLEDG
ncbi:hypothetical protein HG530_006185 [Fusarium avenaceum]|nr:hypothetical protein HG530_006185 [Fusarium avenaceum]